MLTMSFAIAVWSANLILSVVNAFVAARSKEPGAATGWWYAALTEIALLVLLFLHLPWPRSESAFSFFLGFLCGLPIGGIAGWIGMAAAERRRLVHVYRPNGYRG
jgi:hypothetical protein